jgi:N-acetylglucosamine-6-sulfatase
MSAISGRTLVIAAAALLAAAGLGLAISQGPERASTAPQGSHGRPNIVVVMMDELALSQARPRYMPKVTQLLRDQGTSFKNAFLTTPLCCPSRATLLTGQYGHNNGVLKNTYPSLRNTRNVLPAWLHEAGYVTAHVGKFLNRYHHDANRTAVAPGWDQWYTQLDRSQDDYYDWDLSKNGTKIHYGRKNSDYAPRVFERSAVHLVRRFVPRRKPLYLEVDEIAPHPGDGGEGTGCQGTAVPDPRDVGKFQNAQLPHPPSFNEGDMRDKPSFLQTQPMLTQAEIRRRTRNYRCGLASLQQVDRTVGHLHRELKRLGELGRTVFIFYTDNGQFFGEHRVGGGKLYPYEEADRTPLFIRLPARYRKGNKRVAEVSEPVANIDFAPTILRLAHARPCPSNGHCRVMDGRSLLPLLRGKSPRWAADRPLGVELQLQNANPKHAVCKYAGVRLPGVIFVRHIKVADRDTGACVKDRERERYDLSNDPYQLHNLCFGGGSCPTDALQARLKRLLAKIHHCSGVRGRDPHPSPGKYCG